MNSVAINWMNVDGEVKVYEYPPVYIDFDTESPLYDPDLLYMQTSALVVKYEHTTFAYKLTMKHKGDEFNYRVSEQIFSKEDTIQDVLYYFSKQCQAHFGIDDPVPKWLVDSWMKNVYYKTPATPEYPGLLTIPAEKPQGFWGGMFTHKGKEKFNELAKGGMIYQGKYLQKVEGLEGWNPGGAQSGIMPSAMARDLPGVDELVTHPVDGDLAKLYTIIISLNDSYKWKREQIADWIETLDINTTFKVDVNE